MNYRNKAILETLIRVNGLSTQPGFTTNARATSLFGQVPSMITAMEGAGTDQASGRGNAELGTARKQALAKELREMVRDINRTVKGLDEDTHPDAAAQFPKPAAKSYQALLSTARAFLEHISPVKADLIASGMLANFDETLQGLVAEFSSAIQQREGGLGEQVGGTRGLEAHRQEAKRLLQKLDATMSNLLKTNPVLLGNWKRTVHIPRVPRGAESEPVPSSSGSGTGSGGTAPNPLAGSGAGI